MLGVLMNAKGRSPYDEVVDGEGEETHGEPAQQYDHRGRPINPDTKRINRDMIRAHNEVMLVIGVAEPENPYSGPEADSQRRHEAYEESVGLQLATPARRCVESVGILGLHGLRQRILVCLCISEAVLLMKKRLWLIHAPGLHQILPCAILELFRRARTDFSFTRDILAGAPTAYLTDHMERKISYLWLHELDKQLPRRV